jgi:hypothetical protein
MWRKHTTQVLNSVHDKVSERLGGGELSERMKSTSRREYVSFLEEKVRLRARTTSRAMRARMSR